MFINNTKTCHKLKEMEVASIYEMLHATLTLASNTIKLQTQNNSVDISVSNTVGRHERKPFICIKPVVMFNLCTKPSFCQVAPIWSTSQQSPRSTDNRHFNVEAVWEDDLKIAAVVDTSQSVPTTKVTESMVARKRKRTYVPVARKKEVGQTIQRRKSKASVLFDAEHHDKLHLRSDTSQDGLLIRSLDELFKN